MIDGIRIGNALIYDKDQIGIDPDIRQTLKIFYSRNMFIDLVKMPCLVCMVDNEDEAMTVHADYEANFEYLILTYEGTIPNIYLYHENCIRHILDLNKKTNNNWLVSGQLIDQYENRKMFNDPSTNQWQGSFYLFPITCIVNLKKWREIGRPTWGQASKEPVEHAKPIRSDTNIHDNYTPLYLDGYDGAVKTPVKKGWNIIDASVKNNMPVHNLSIPIRQSQNYLYPENDVQLYNNFWRSIYNLPKMNDQYIRVLESVLPEKNKTVKKWACFIRNTEDIIPWGCADKFNEHAAAVSTLITPCSGFKDFILTVKKPSQVAMKKIIHYDIIPQCIDIRKRLINEWDGRRHSLSELLTSIKDYYVKTERHENCFHMHSLRSYDDFYVEILKSFDSEEHLEAEWIKFKQIDHKYIHCDILNEPYLVTNQAKNENVYICLSDIAGWRSNLIGNGYLKLRNQLKRVIVSLQENNCKGLVDYKDPGTDLQLLQHFNEFITHVNTPIE